jgi:NO-binding membrane sensor protein with MHYT domain
MRSDKLDDAEVEARTEGGVVYRLLDPAFGFFVWAIHFVAVYVTAAVACQLRLDGTFVIALVAVTLAAAAIVLAHAVKRYRQRGEVRDHGFLIRIAVGHDAVAALAILWQVFPLLMVPVCR